MISFKWCGVQFDIMFVSSGKFYSSIAKHCHAKNCYEIHYVNGGSGKVVAEDNEYELMRGTTYVTGAGAFHEQQTNPQNPLDEWCVYIQSKTLKPENNMAIMFLEKPFWIGKSSIDEAVYLRILEEYDNKKFGFEQIIGGLMNVVLTQLVRCYYPDSVSAVSDSIDLNNRRLYLIECAFLYEAKTLTLSSLSEKIGVCERQTQRILMKHYGMTFREKKKNALTNI